MKILMIGWGYPPRIDGGLDTHVYEISRELAKSIDVFLTLPEFNSPKSLPRDIKIIPVPCPGFSDISSLLRCVKIYNKNIVKMCRGIGFDIIHSHDWLGAEASERLKKMTGKPWVFTLHSLEYMRSCSQANSFIEKMESRAAKMCDVVLTVSNFMKTEISNNYGVENERIKVVYNSADARKGNPEEIRKRLGIGKRPMVLFLGRLSRQKGVEHFVLSARIVVKEFPEAIFVVAGDGYLRESLERFSKNLGIANVIFTGFVPEDEVFSYYSAADVFVLPSIFEPFGITVLESLLSGTPVIVGEGAGVLERIPEMECIFKVKPGNSLEIAEKISYVLNKRIGVSERDKQALKKAYSWERSAMEILDVYRNWSK
ncbi:MAG: glycosyltransferase family 4 protein [Candidatus Aenigmatarchaeota archaeon]